ncbi:DUF1450 domain-containing protein [Thermohalobacter berrensis]|uniref:UDP-N-acetylmuramoylalanine--D-glutamate ligase n=1 Tax=Thermohalobacter berrensis TaxID=99594 RepID=A0A419SXR9_9FIRM|nr:DUF1450 domain-containing protein [Thermohalobacter berrensis]RKD30060.1 hypothetical protein BET03_04980 [Thermohalobacter berrensis]
MKTFNIQFCEHNFSHGTDKVAEKIESELVNANVEIQACLGFCDDCAASPYALVDGELIQTDTPDELYEEIKAYLT